MTESIVNTTESLSGKVGTHGFKAKLIHWGFILVYGFAISKQVDEVEELEDFALLQEEVAIAVIFLVLLFARYIYMQSEGASVMPDDTPKRISLLAKAVHLGMYASMALIAISGLAIGAMFYSGVKEGALFEAVLLSHEIVFWTSVNLIALHIAGAVYHRLKKDGIWSSMVPVWKEETAE